MSSIRVNKKQGESPNALLFNFTKRVKRSGVLKEARKRLFHVRRINRVKRRISALHREAKKSEIERARRLGVL